MKKIYPLILSAIIGSTITLTIARYSNVSQKTLKIEHVTNPETKRVLYTKSHEGEIIPLDFTSVSELVMPAVVHIRATKTLSSQMRYENQRSLPDPFKDFFDDDFFHDFFAPHHRHEQPLPHKRESSPQIVGSGSGVIINEQGYIITNNHVINESQDIEVTLHDNRTYKAAIVGTDPATDLALIQIKEDNLPTIPLVNSDEVKVGEWVLAVGNPFNLNSTVTAGIVSAKGRNINILKDESAIESFIQTDAAINPGNSGGALVNLNGGLVGINTAIASPTGSYAGYGFAVPSNIVNKVVEDLLNYGVVQRGFLGIIIRGVDGNLAKQEKLDITEGVFVDSLLKNSAASDAGIKVGDVILEIQGVPVKTAPELQEIIARHRPGDKVSLLIDRKGKKRKIDVILKNKQGDNKLLKEDNKGILNILGVELETIDKQTAKKLNIDCGVRIKKLYDGKLKRHTSVKEDFIITKAGGKKATSADELIELLNKHKGGIMLEGVYEDYPGTYYYAFGL